MKVKLDHIAIAVKSINDSIKLFESLGLKFDDHREEVVSQKVKTAFCKIDEFSKIELLEATSKESTIQKFIDKKGEGIHHLCFRVASVRELQTKLSQKGMNFIYEEPFIGAGNCLVNFIHPKSANGILIEISEKLK